MCCYDVGRGEEKCYEQESKVSTVDGGGCILHGLNLGQAVHELAPVVHDDFDPRLFEHLSHLLLLDDTTVAADVTDGGNACSDCAESAALAILDGNTFSWLFADDLAGVKVDGRIWLGGWNGQTGGGAEDVVGREEFFLVDFLHTRLNSAQGAGADDRHAVFLTLVQLLQDGHDPDTRLGLGLQGLNDLAQLAADIFVDLGIGELEAVFLLQAADNATEVLTDEGGHERRASVAIRDVMLGKHLVRKFGTCFEGEFF